MKTLQCLIILCFFYTRLIGQDEADVQVDYEIRFNDAFDRGRRDRIHSGYLIIHQNLSRYYMISDKRYEATNEYDQRFDPDTNIQVFTDHSKGLMIAQEFSFSGKPFNLIDTLYPMRWDIHNETKKIDSLICIRATCTFRGRNYEAWFSADIPLPFGPWKMGGLPGLIIDLKDEEENLVVRLRKISKVQNNFSLPTETRYTMAEHIAEMKKFLERVQANARASGSGDCVSCQTQSRFELFTWEKIPR